MTVPGVPRRWLPRLAFAIAALPLVLSVAIAIARGEWMAGDRSVMGVFTHDVFTRNPPLLGTISTLGNYAETGQGAPVHHLGPAQFYALAVPDWIAGGHPAGLLIGGLLVNLAAIAVTLWATRRRVGDVGAAGITLVAVGLAYGLGPALLRDIWTPYLGLWPLLALLTLTWSLLDGDVWALPWAAGFASFLAQIELLFVGPAAVLTVVGVVGLIVDRRMHRHDEDRPGIGRPVIWSAVASFVIWLPVIIEELQTGSGNITLLIESLGGQGERAGWSFVVDNVVAQMALPPVWLNRATTPLEVGSGTTLIGAMSAILVTAALALLTVRAVADRAQRRTVATLLITCWAMLLGAVFNLAITPEDGLIGLQYRRWMWPAGAFIWFAIVVALVSERRPKVRRGAELLLAIALVATIPASIGQHTPLPDDLATNKVVESAWGPTIDRLPRQPTSVGYFGGAAAFAVGPEITRRLISGGYTVRVNEAFADNYGAHRVLDPDDPPPQTLAIVSDEGTLAPPMVPAAVLGIGRIDGTSGEGFVDRAGPLLERVRTSGPFVPTAEGRLLLEGMLADEVDPAGAAEALLSTPTRGMFDERVLDIAARGELASSPLTDEEVDWLAQQLGEARVMTYLLPPSGA